MVGFIEGRDRTQSVLFPERLDDWIHEDSTVRVIDVFIDGLDLRKLGFDRAQPAATGRPGYRPTTLLKIYVYGYLNRVQSSRRLETEAQRSFLHDAGCDEFQGYLFAPALDALSFEHRLPAQPKAEPPVRKRGSRIRLVRG
jgi:hypothetical protein